VPEKEPAAVVQASVVGVVGLLDDHWTGGHGVGGLNTLDDSDRRPEAVPGRDDGDVEAAARRGRRDQLADLVLAAWMPGCGGDGGDVLSCRVGEDDAGPVERCHEGSGDRMESAVRSRCQTAEQFRHEDEYRVVEVTDQ